MGKNYSDFLSSDEEKKLAPEKAAAEKTGTGSLSLTLDYAAPNNQILKENERG